MPFSAASRAQVSCANATSPSSSGRPSSARASRSARSSIGNDRTLVGLSRWRHWRLSSRISASEVNSTLAERRGLASSGATCSAAEAACSARPCQSPAGQGSSTSNSSSTSRAPVGCALGAQKAVGDEVAELSVDVDREATVADDLRFDALAETAREARQHAVDGEQVEPEADQVEEAEG